MKAPSFKWVAISAGLLVFVAGGLWVWFGDRKTDGTAPGDSPAPETMENPAPAGAVASPPSRTPRSGPKPKRSGTASPETLSNPLPPESAPDSPGDPAPWEKKIDDILTADGDESQKAQKLLELIPTLPEDAQIEAAQHLVNLVPDEGYAAASPYLTNAQTSEAVLDVLIGDLMNRPNTLKLPLLLEVARVPEHPKAGEAKELLEFYVGEDLGADWSAWETALATWLKENPE